MLALAGAVLFATVCRLDPMELGKHKPLWLGVYMAFAVGALWQLIEAARALMGLAQLYAPAALYLIGAGLYLWGSRHTWAKGPPAFMSTPGEALPEPFGLAAGQAQKPTAWPWPGEPGD